MECSIPGGAYFRVDFFVFTRFVGHTYGTFAKWAKNEKYVCMVFAFGIAPKPLKQKHGKTYRMVRYSANPDVR